MRKLPGLVLLVASTLLVLLNRPELPVFLLVLVAWSDYVSLSVPGFVIYGSLVALTVLQADSFSHIWPMIILFVAYSLLLTSGRERLAYGLTVVAIPLAFLLSRSFSSAVPWALVGLMLGYTENVVMEESGEGDVYLLAVLFALLREWALVAYSITRVFALFYVRDVYGFRIYPYGTALFVASAPVLAGIEMDQFEPVPISIVAFLLAMIYFHRSGHGGGLAGYVLLVVLMGAIPILRNGPLYLPLILGGLIMVGSRIASGSLHYHGFSTVTPGELRAVVDAFAILVTVWEFLRGGFEPVLSLPFALVFSMVFLHVAKKRAERISPFGVLEIFLAGIWMSRWLLFFNF